MKRMRLDSPVFNPEWAEYTRRVGLVARLHEVRSALESISLGDDDEMAHQLAVIAHNLQNSLISWLERSVDRGDGSQSSPPHS